MRILSVKTDGAVLCGYEIEPPRFLGEPEIAIWTSNIKVGLPSCDCSNYVDAVGGCPWRTHPPVPRELNIANCALIAPFGGHEEETGRSERISRSMPVRTMLASVKQARVDCAMEGRAFSPKGVLHSGVGSTLREARRVPQKFSSSRQPMSVTPVTPELPPLITAHSHV